MDYVWLPMAPQGCRGLDVNAFCQCLLHQKNVYPSKMYPPPPPKTIMAMENPPFEDVFPFENGDFPHVMLVFRGVYSALFHLKVYCSRNCDKVISSFFLWIFGAFGTFATSQVMPFVILNGKFWKVSKFQGRSETQNLFVDQFWVVPFLILYP